MQPSRGDAGSPRTDGTSGIGKKGKVDRNSRRSSWGGKNYPPPAQPLIPPDDGPAHRAAAELDNYRKRTARDLQETVKYANSSLLESLLPVLDNFDYGMQAAKAESEGSNLFIGLSMVLRQVQDFLKDNGVEEIAAVGVAFNPNVHEAVSEQTSDTVAEGTVVVQTRKGYKLRDRLLRPASVIVSSGPAPADAPAV